MKLRRITLDKTGASMGRRKVSLTDFCNKAAFTALPQLNEIMPGNFKGCISVHGFPHYFFELPPAVYSLEWIINPHEPPYTWQDASTYRTVRVAFPYQIICLRGPNSQPILAFRNAPLECITDDLFYPPLLNFHQYPMGAIGCSDGTMECSTMREAYQYATHNIFGTRFNNHMSYADCFWRKKPKDDERFRTIEAWEEATAKDPKFVLGVAWQKTDSNIADILQMLPEPSITSLTWIPFAYAQSNRPTLPSKL